MKVKSRKLMNWSQILMRTLLRTTCAALIACILVSCGYHRFHLRPDGELPKDMSTMEVVVLAVGEKRHAIEQRGNPASWGYSPGLVSSDPDVVRVEYGGGEQYDGNIWLVGVRAGEARVAIGNAWIRNGERWEDHASQAHFDLQRHSFVVRVQPASPSH